MDFQFGASQPVMEEPFRPTVFIGREIAVDRDDIPSFTFDADAGPDFSDSEPGEDDEAVRAFSQEVLDGAQGHNEDDGADEDSGVAAHATDAVDPMKDQGYESDVEDLPVNDAPKPEVEDHAVADKEEENVAPALPAFPAKKKPTESPVKGPVRKPTKPAAKATSRTTPKPAAQPAKPAAKASPRKAGKPKKELPPEKPTRISDRVSKPRARAAAHSTVQPRSAVPKTKAARKKTASTVANDRKTSGQQWEVESIVDSIIDADTHQHFYQVKWKGYSNKDNTWEPKINLANCQAAIRQFKSDNSKSGKRKAK